MEKENNELIGKNKELVSSNNQLESNQEKERMQFQESLDQINRRKTRAEINNTGIGTKVE